MTVDAGSTLTASAVAALTMSDLVMLVANPDVPCLRNLQRLMDALRLAGVAPERIRIVLNRTSDNGALQRLQIEQVLGRTIDFQVLERLPHDGGGDEQRRAGVIGARRRAANADRRDCPRDSGLGTGGGVEDEKRHEGAKHAAGSARSSCFRVFAALT